MTSSPQVFLHDIACFLDAHIVIIYAVLVVLALVSQIGPLQRLTQHGKSRYIRRQQQKSDGRRHASSSSSSWWQWITQGDVWMMTKQKFLHFYIWGTVVLVTMRLHDDYDMSWWFSNSRNAAQALLLLHLLRRWYECVHVHEWQTTSRMHFLIYIVGIVYYTLLPFIFCRVPHCRRPAVMATTTTTTTTPGQADHDSKASSFIFLHVLAIPVCLYAQHQQARHHVILANLRRKKDDKKDNVKSTTQQQQPNHSSSYQLPVGGWFTHVACPHYLAEILFYAGLAGLLLPATPGRAAVILLWVTTTLTLNALQAQAWYQENIPGYGQLGRWAIFPYIV